MIVNIENKELFAKYKFNNLTDQTWSVSENPNSYCFNGLYLLKNPVSQQGQKNSIQ